MRLKRFIAAALVALALSWMPAVLHAAISFGVFTGGEDITGSGVSSVSTSSTMNVAAGDAIFACVKHIHTATPSVSDGGSNSLTLAISKQNTGSTIDVSLFYKLNASANATATWTASFSGTTSSYPAIGAVNVAGVATSSALDQTASAEATGTTTVTSSAFTPSQTNEIAIACAQENSNGSAWTNPSGYSTAGDTGTANEIYIAYDITLTAGSQQVAIVNDQNQYKSMVVATFKEASGGGGGGSTCGNLLLLRVGCH